MCPSLWWLLLNIAKTFLRVKKVGSPQESFSVAPGIARQIRRTRLRCSWCSLETDNVLVSLKRIINNRAISRTVDHLPHAALNRAFTAHQMRKVAAGIRTVFVD